MPIPCINALREFIEPLVYDFFDAVRVPDAAPVGIPPEWIEADNLATRDFQAAVLFRTLGTHASDFIEADRVNSIEPAGIGHQKPVAGYGENECVPTQQMVPRHQEKKYCPAEENRPNEEFEVDGQVLQGLSGRKALIYGKSAPYGHDADPDKIANL